jgi:nitrogen regulatory protein PII
MKAIKRVEIIVPRSQLNQVAKLLDREKMPGYTVVPEVTGKGHRGVRDGAGLTTAFSNSYLLLACDQEELDRLQEPLRELLTRYGGVVLVSDAMWLIH